MFGYVLPERAHLYMKDFDLYRAFYCGICKSMQWQFGNASRFTINYDITFLSILLHNFLNVDVSMEQLKCITKPFTKRQSVKRNDLTDLLASFNVILSYNSLKDKVLDDKSKKAKAAMGFLKKAYKKACKNLPGAKEIITERYNALRELEKQNCNSVDKIAHEFAQMMSESVDLIISTFIKAKNLEESVIKGENKQSLLRLVYNVGKWIYMIDALDDYDKDVKTKSYNPFVLSYITCDKKTLMESFGGEMVFTFTTCLNTIANSFKEVKFNFNTDFIKNVILNGMPLMTKGIMRGEKWQTTYSKFSD